MSSLLSKKWFIGIILVASFFLGLLLAFLGSSLAGAISKNPKPSPTPSFSKALPKPINKNNPQTGVYNAILLGYGGGNHEGTLLTDSIIVIHVDTNTHKATMISIPRDLWIPGNTKINAAGITGFNNSMPAVQNVTGLPMNYYVAIDFDQFSKLVDDLGGVTVTMPNNLDDSFYPIIGQENNTCGISEDQINTWKNQFSGFDLEKQFTCRYEHLQYSKGQIVNLDGATALKISRSRHGDSDFARSERQFAVLQGVLSKLLTLKSLNKLDQTITTLFSVVQTDLDLGTIKSLTQVFGDPGLYKINQVHLNTDNVLTQGTSNDGQFILYPKTGLFDYSRVKNYINSNL